MPSEIAAAQARIGRRFITTSGESVSLEKLPDVAAGLAGYRDFGVKGRSARRRKIASAALRWLADSVA